MNKPNETLYATATNLVAGVAYALALYNTADYLFSFLFALLVLAFGMVIYFKRILPKQRRKYAKR